MSEPPKAFQIRNRIFYEKCKSFAIGAFKLLNSYLKKGESIPEYMMQDISLNGECVWEYPFRRTLVLWPFVSRHEKELEQQPEFLDCKRYMSEEKSISKHLSHLVGHTHTKGFIDTELILHKLLYESIDATKLFEFNSDIFDCTYAKIEDFFYCEKIKFVLSAPLQNFQCELEKIELAKDLRIVRMSKQEREDLWRGNRYSGWIPDSLLPHFTYSLQLNFEKQKIYEDTSQKINQNSPEETPAEIARATFDKVVSALRLFKHGIAGFSTIMTTPITWFPYGGGFTNWYGKHFEPSRFILTEPEVKEYKALFQEFSQKESLLQDSSFLNLALRRFNYAHERKRPEDKLIDYMIALETMYIVDDPGEYGYKIAIRAASLLGKTLQEKERIFLEIKKAYHLRSKIVHGSKKVGDKNSVSIQDVSKIEQYVRGSILESIKLIPGKSHSEIIKSVEEAFFS